MIFSFVHVWGRGNFFISMVNELKEVYAICGMQVMDSFEEPIIFDYCCYGRNYRKRTMLWAAHNIRYDERDNL